tara:strand:+ start:2788 stop:3411 length:624 start_codon:yes stop_codon:yes gene_type:complete
MKYLNIGLISFAMMSSLSFAGGDHSHGHDAEAKQVPQKMDHDMRNMGKSMGGDMMKDMDHSGHNMKKGDSEGHHGEGMGHGESIVGKPGSEDNVTKVVKVEATDQMRFIYEPFEAKAGETVKFVVTNTGKIMHEFAVGTKAEHKEHGKVMMANPNMRHGSSASMVSVDPGKTEVLIWEFGKPISAQLACNVPGHYQAGMHSDIKIKK